MGVCALLNYNYWRLQCQNELSLMKYSMQAIGFGVASKATIAFRTLSFFSMRSFMLHSVCSTHLA